MSSSQPLKRILEGMSLRCCARHVKQWKEDETTLTDAELLGGDRGGHSVKIGDDLLCLCVTCASDPTPYVDEVADKLSDAKGRSILPSTLRC